MYTLDLHLNIYKTLPLVLFCLITKIFLKKLVYFFIIQLILLTFKLKIFESLENYFILKIK